MCWPSLKTIGEQAGIDERTVRRHLPALERAGIEIRRSFVRAGKGRCHLYLFPLQPDRRSGSRSDEQPDSRAQQPDSQTEQVDSQAEQPDGVSNKPIRTNKESKLLNR